MPSFLSKVFGRKKDDKDSPPRAEDSELLDGKFEAVSPSAVVKFPEVANERRNRHDRESSSSFNVFRSKSKSRPTSPVPKERRVEVPQLSLNLPGLKDETTTTTMMVGAASTSSSSSRALGAVFEADPESRILSDEAIGSRRLNPLETLILIRACSESIIARGLETLGVMHPHWYSASPEVQRRLISLFLQSLAPKVSITTLSPTPSSIANAFDSEISATNSPYDVAAVLRWGLRHLQLEGTSFGKEDTWYKAFFDSERTAGYPPNGYTTTLAPLLPASHLELLTATLEIFSSLAAHAEANGISGSKLSKFFGLWLLSVDRTQDDDDWSTFYTRWERTGRMLEHIFLSRIRDDATVSRMPTRLLELVKRYPYSTDPTADLLARPRFSTVQYDALFVRIETELSATADQPSHHPLRIISEAFKAEAVADAVAVHTPELSGDVPKSVEPDVPQEPTNGNAHHDEDPVAPVPEVAVPTPELSGVAEVLQSVEPDVPQEPTNGSAHHDEDLAPVVPLPEVVEDVDVNLVKSDDTPNATLSADLPVHSNGTASAQHGEDAAAVSEPPLLSEADVVKSDENPNAPPSADLLCIFPGRPQDADHDGAIATEVATEVESSPALEEAKTAEPEVEHTVVPEVESHPPVTEPVVDESTHVKLTADVPLGLQETELETAPADVPPTEAPHTVEDIKALEPPSTESHEEASAAHDEPTIGDEGVSEHQASLVAAGDLQPSESVEVTTSAELDDAQVVKETEDAEPAPSPAATLTVAEAVVPAVAAAGALIADTEESVTDHLIPQDYVEPETVHTESTTQAQESTEAVVEPIEPSISEPEPPAHELATASESTILALDLKEENVPVDVDETTSILQNNQVDGPAQSATIADSETSESKDIQIIAKDLTTEPVFDGETEVITQQETVAETPVSEIQAPQPAIEATNEPPIPEPVVPKVDNLEGVTEPAAYEAVVPAAQPFPAIQDPQSDSNYEYPVVNEIAGAVAELTENKVTPDPEDSINNVVLQNGEQPEEREQTRVAEELNVAENSGQPEAEPVSIENVDTTPVIKASTRNLEDEGASANATTSVVKDQVDTYQVAEEPVVLDSSHAEIEPTEEVEQTPLAAAEAEVLPLAEETPLGENSLQPIEEPVVQPEHEVQAETEPPVVEPLALTEELATSDPVVEPRSADESLKSGETEAVTQEAVTEKDAHIQPEHVTHDDDSSVLAVVRTPALPEESAPIGQEVTTSPIEEAPAVEYHDQAPVPTEVTGTERVETLPMTEGRSTVEPVAEETPQAKAETEPIDEVPVVESVLVPVVAGVLVEESAAAADPITLHEKHQPSPETEEATPADAKPPTSEDELNIVEPSTVETTHAEAEPEPQQLSYAEPTLGHDVVQIPVQEADLVVEFPLTTEEPATAS
ncbi:hypothetical protein H0H93_016727, partial [Arthromyces matolae]